METIGARIKHQRTKQDLSRQALADALGVSYETVRQWEAEIAQPRPQLYERLSEALGCDMTWLVTGYVGVLSQTGLPPVSNTATDELKAQINQLPLSEQTKIMEDIARRLREYHNKNTSFTENLHSKD